jgi:hypothetical protein
MKESEAPNTNASRGTATLPLQESSWVILAIKSLT